MWKDYAMVQFGRKRRNGSKSMEARIVLACTLLFVLMFTTVLMVITTTDGISIRSTTGEITKVVSVEAVTRGDVPQDSSSFDGHGTDHPQDVDDDVDDDDDNDDNDDPVWKEPKTKPTGFVILGMHRSGTSMLGGLLTLGFGYRVGQGKELQPPAEDNPRGFFERWDVMFQNDAWLEEQGMHWNSADRLGDFRTTDVDGDGIDVARSRGRSRMGLLNDQGQKALKFVNQPPNANVNVNANVNAVTQPWFLKDPRMCLTLPFWREHLPSHAIVLTYRHPWEVARSLQKRNRLELSTGLRLWYLYNRAALLHSSTTTTTSTTTIRNRHRPCRVLTSSRAILRRPQEEVTRIVSELSERCGVLPPPTGHTMREGTVEQFVNPDLQHNHHEIQPPQQQQQQPKTNANANANAKPDECESRHFESHAMVPSKASSQYVEAMTLYCDMEDGKAFQPGYQFP